MSDKASVILLTKFVSKLKKALYIKKKYLNWKKNVNTVRLDSQDCKIKSYTIKNKLKR